MPCYQCSMTNRKVTERSLALKLAKQAVQSQFGRKCRILMPSVEEVADASTTQCRRVMCTVKIAGHSPKVAIIETFYQIEGSIIKPISTNIRIAPSVHSTILWPGPELLSASV